MRKNRRRKTTPSIWRLNVKRVRKQSLQAVRSKTRKMGLFRQRVRTESASALYLVVFFVAVVTAVAAFSYHLNIRFQGVQLGYQTSQLRSERARLLAEQRELRLELASLRDPERVAAEAREKCEMAIPDHQRIIAVKKKKKAVIASGGAR
ncbi:MAG: cell division protein FtsL [Myxococcota bacterium]|nr:cell division protein FtsL [Myxococcota bacterium]